MSKNLLIVESPAKAKTIEKYLGSDYQVKASFGHIRDLPKDDKAIRIEADFEPVYEVSADKAEVVRELKKLAKQADTIWLATDEDREGEAISWHLAEVLGLDLATTRRIVFHEITQSAIQKAIAQPRTIDMRLVDAQQARRVLDRLVGFELSPILWKKVKFGLSAGRVQSVAVRLIVEREREVAQFKPSAYFNVLGDFLSSSSQAFKASLPKRIEDEAGATAYMQRCIQATFTIGKVETKPGKRSPAAPFTTSTLQQEAARKLGYAVGTTMRLAQTLYEAGHITYMRTDSVNLSETALAAAQAAITDQFGAAYHKRRTYTSRSANAQEAHEAIRPTDFRARSVPGDRMEQRLYDLIWKRAAASQMADAVLERTAADVQVQPQKGQALPSLQATGEVVKFEGFLKLYLEGKDEEGEEEQRDLLPPLRPGEVVQLQRLTATERFTRPAARYSEASLVKQLEELGIGRPSTYAPTISTIQKRNYVVKEDREGSPRSYRVLLLQQGVITPQAQQETTGAEKAKLFPTDLGTLVTDFLLENFPQVVDYSFTAKLEEEFDEISRGQLGWKKMLGVFYPPFHERVESTVATAARVVGERVLGTHPESGKPVLARLGKYGPIAQIGTADDDKKQFASLRPNQRLETITLEEALALFRLPRLLGKYEEQPVTVNIGRFGPYLQHAGKFVSLPKTVDPYLVELEEAIILVEAKRKLEREKVILAFEGSDVQVLNGRWGPYIAAGGENYKLPKGADPASLTLAQVQELIASQAANPRTGFKRKAAPNKTTKPLKGSLTPMAPKGASAIAKGPKRKKTVRLAAEKTRTKPTARKSLPTATSKSKRGSNKADSE